MQDVCGVCNTERVSLSGRTCVLPTKHADRLSTPSTYTCVRYCFADLASATACAPPCRIPYFIDGDIKLGESLSIMYYLLEKYGA